MLNWLLMLIPLFAILGWWIGRYSLLNKSTDLTPVTRDYLQGINYLLNEQADKAVELFINMMTVDTDTVETHIALGNLFRRRGEVDRAIRIHQNVIARPQLAKIHRIQALLALGRDYMLAGVLDRAEKLMLEVVNSGEYVSDSLHYLLDIYQQEKDWEQAIITAERLESVSSKSMQRAIAHYYCELAIEAMLKLGYEQAIRYVKRALLLDKQCVRATLKLGAWEIELANYQAAMRILQRIREQDPDFLPEAVPMLLECAKQLKTEPELMVFLQQALEAQPQVSLAMLLSDHIQQTQGPNIACDFMMKQLTRHPTLMGLHHYLKLQVDLALGKEKELLMYLHSLIAQILANKPGYQCVNCGYASKVLHWNCPSCKLWGSTKPATGMECE